MKTGARFFILAAALVFSGAVYVQHGCGGKRFIVSGWIPFWQKSQGCAAVISNLGLFSGLSPFAFEVEVDGSLKDTLSIDVPPWAELSAKARESGVSILPTILWTDAKAIHEMLDSASARQRHIRGITALIREKGFDGIDIDYEGKDVSDRELFSVFIAGLSRALKSEGYYFSCTVEARTADDPPDGWQGTRAMAWANDLSVLNKYCDEVRIMAYDQPFQTKGAKEWRDDSQRPYAPNAGISWVEETIKYAAGKIAAKKIVLGIPTYGWEFIIEGGSGDWSYKRFKSIVYPRAIESAKAHSAVCRRDESGELSFVFQDGPLTHLDYFPDAESIRRKVKLAKRYGLGGVVFFKLDGLEDERMWEVLKEELTDSPPARGMTCCKSGNVSSPQHTGGQAPVAGRPLWYGSPNFY